MNPADLVPYREHVWSREVNRYGTEAWDALRDDVALNGFREPAFLEYNHQTGQGYLGEGNHRLAVALELDVPLPVAVFRTRKTAPDYPMQQITEPGQYSMRDARGFSRFPEFIRPSEIGLPTVPGERHRVAEAIEAEAIDPDRVISRAPAQSDAPGFEL